MLVFISFLSFYCLNYFVSSNIFIFLFICFLLFHRCFFFFVLYINIFYLNEITSCLLSYVFIFNLFCLIYIVLFHFLFPFLFIHFFYFLIINLFCFLLLTIYYFLLEVVMKVSFVFLCVCVCIS